MRILIRADASQRIGHGHVMRCLNLANALKGRGAEVLFVCREHPGHLCDEIAARGFRVQRLPCARRSHSDDARADWLGAPSEEDANATRAAAESLGGFVDWVIADNYAIDSEWERAVGSITKRIMVVDDLADREHQCDVLLDQNYVRDMNSRYDGLVPETCARLLGPTFALLHEDYSRYHDRIPPRRGRIGTVLVAFGGVDTKNLSQRTLTAVLGASSDVNVDVVLGKNSPNTASVLASAGGETRVRIHEGLTSMATVMARADLAIGSAGTTSWERLCLGLPSLVVTLAENQRSIAEALDAAGLARWLGDSEDVGDDLLVREVSATMNAGIDEEWSRRCLRIVDGRGASRVATILLASADSTLVVRLASLKDEGLLLEWANDPVTRRNGLSTKRISPDSHREWFWKRLRDVEGCQLYVVEIDGQPMGQVRLERTGTAWEVHYAVSPPYRKRGLGARMLAAALAQFEQTTPGEHVIGRVKEDNTASRRIFESLGFAAETEGKGMMRLTRMAT